MARFDVYQLRGSGALVLDCQSDLLAYFDTRFVVPLMPPSQGPAPAATLNPVFNIQGQTVAMYTQYAGAMRKSELGSVVMSLAEHDIAIGRAIDMLLSGF